MHNENSDDVCVLLYDGGRKRYDGQDCSLHGNTNDHCAIVACEQFAFLRHKARTMVYDTYALIVKALVQPANANETKQEENFILFLGLQQGAISLWSAEQLHRDGLMAPQNLRLWWKRTWFGRYMIFRGADCEL
jgi:hypothetical protein